MDVPILYARGRATVVYQMPSLDSLVTTRWMRHPVNGYQTSAELIIQAARHEDCHDILQYVLKSSTRPRGHRLMAGMLIMPFP